MEVETGTGLVVGWRSGGAPDPCRRWRVRNREEGGRIGSRSGLGNENQGKTERLSPGAARRQGASGRSNCAQG